jgi:hypothetical protein
MFLIFKKWVFLKNNVLIEKMKTTEMHEEHTNALQFYHLAIITINI